MPGYSSKALIDKLGVRPGMRAIFINAPNEYFEALGPIPNVETVDTGAADFIHAFYTNRDELVADYPRIQRDLADGGTVWISWPKKSSRIPANIGEQDLRDILLPTGLVDTKVAAVTDIWSGLKFQRRRPKP